MKIAQFKNVVYQFITVSEATLETCKDYIRISDYVDVQFTPRSYDDSVMDEVGRIDQAINDVMSDAGNKVAALNKRKQELLAITVQA